MFKRFNTNNNSAQSIMEYTIVIGIVATIIFALQPMVKRSFQGLIKMTADQIGYQQNGDQLGAIKDGGQLINAELAGVGRLDASYTNTRVNVDEELVELPGGFREKIYHDDYVETDTRSLMNLGFSPLSPP